MHRPIIIATLGSYIEHDYTLTVYCGVTGCSNSKRADLQALAEKYGLDYNMVKDERNVGARMRCEKCGALGSAKFNLSPPHKPVRKE